MRQLPTSIRIWLRMVALLLGMLWLNRILFSVAYPQLYRTLSTSELWSAWLIGLRFDFASALITITLPFVLLWIPLPCKWSVVVAKISAVVTILLVLTVAAFLWADGIYYAEAGHHTTYEVTNLGHDVYTMFILLWREYFFLCVGLILFWIFVTRLVWRIFRPLTNATAWHTPQKWWEKILLPVVMILISVVGIRGGLQLKPMRISFAYRGDNILAGHLALNGWYTFIATAFAEKSKAAVFMPDEAAFARTRTQLLGTGERFLDNKYPLYRESSAPSPIAQPGEKLNVVLIIVESLTADYLKSFGGTVATMPFFDSLASQSVIFNHCYSIGTRSMEGLSAVLASIPNLMGAPFLGSTQEQTKLLGLGTLFREQGYTTRFMHGAKPGSMYIQQLANIAGYGKFYDENDFPRNQSDGHWGIWDRYTLQWMSREMDTLREPFHYGLFTLSTHNPFILPPEFNPPFPATEDRKKLWNTFANFDLELRKFFTYESRQPRFQRTIYVILGDHTSMIPPEDGTDTHFRVGCLFYAPGRLAPRVVEAPASQLDIEPTLIQLCGLQVKHACFGRSLWDTTATQRFAYFTQAGMVAWRDSNRLLVNNLERDIGLYNLAIDPHTRNNILLTESAAADSMRLNLYAYYQTAERLLNGNRLVPLVEK